MSYLAEEESVEAGSPIELYRFSNLEELFTYTSGNISVFFGGETYIPRPISRGEDEVEASQRQRKMTIKMPANDPFALRYYPGLPVQQDELTIFRFHTSDGPTPEVVIAFQGRVTNVAAAGNEAKVAVNSDGAVLEHVSPRQTTRNLCNHVLYDSRCQVVDTSFRLTGVIDTISPDGLTLRIDTGASTIPDTGNELSTQLGLDSTYFDGGSLERGVLERRMVRNMVDVGGNQADLTVILAFAILSVGTSITLFAGCDHQFPTCRDKFTNKDRYGGFKDVPRKNLFDTGVENA